MYYTKKNSINTNGKISIFIFWVYTIVERYISRTFFRSLHLNREYSLCFIVI